MLEPEQVADDVVDAIRDERFFVLPHPEVADYMQLKASDPERWLGGHAQAAASRQERVTEPDASEMPTLQDGAMHRSPATLARLGSAAGRADPVPPQRQGALGRRPGRRHRRPTGASRCATRTARPDRCAPSASRSAGRVPRPAALATRQRRGHHLGTTRTLRPSRVAVLVNFLRTREREKFTRTRSSGRAISGHPSS